VIAGFAKADARGLARFHSPVAASALYFRVRSGWRPAMAQRPAQRRYTHESGPERMLARVRRQRRNPLPDWARRSLKTQQHAHLDRMYSIWCASRFEPSGIDADAGGQN
jgi:hypothetical protein